jgi:hypothetical protein
MRINVIIGTVKNIDVYASYHHYSFLSNILPLNNELLSDIDKVNKQN